MALRMKASTKSLVTDAERTPAARYDDPLDLVWLAAAEHMGMRVERSADAYASWDGAGTLSLTTAEHMDPDDCLAQMIFHEACHALVAGPPAWQKRDWGLDNTSDRDRVQEHATNRLQAYLADAHGLREFFGTTTEFRSYYDALPADPLAPDGDPAVPVARSAYERARTSPWGRLLETALARTAALAAVVRPQAPHGSLWARARPMHAVGFALSPEPTVTCGGCAWSYRHSRRSVELRCRQSGLGAAAKAVHAEERGCARWEARFTEDECASCGACCREGFDLVQVRPREGFRRAYPELVEKSILGFVVPRPGGRCVVLDGSGATDTPYRCRHYADRPRSCADFAVGGDACLEARRRVRLSR
jgi:hypothetical protein